MPRLVLHSGQLQLPNILKRAHEDRKTIFVAGHPEVPSLSVASPTPWAHYKALSEWHVLNIQVFLDSEILAPRQIRFNNKMGATSLERGHTRRVFHRPV